MGDIHLSQVIFICWVLWTNLILPESQVEASVTKKLESQIESSSTEQFGSKIEASEVIRLCNLTGPDFWVCILCLDGLYPAQTRNDDIEIEKLGGRTIQCAHNAAVIAGDDMNVFSTNSTGGLQEAAVFCTPKLQKAAELFNRALDFWTEKQKDQALEMIQYGLDSYNECIVRVPPETPYSLFHELYRVRGRAEVAQIFVRSINV